MGSFLNAAHDRRSGRTNVVRGRKVKSPVEQAAEAQKQAFKYNEGAIGEEGAAVAKEQVMETGEKLLQQLRAAGITSGGDWDRAAKMRTHGYDPQQVEAPFLAKAAESLSWLDKLGATVRFGIGDVFGLDSKQGTEFDFEDFKDIWGGDWESIKERRGEKAVGESGRFGGSDMLDALGWEAEFGKENWFNNIAHATAGFVAEVATDPLTFVGGGLLGMGKKQAMSMTSKLVRNTYDDVGRAVLAGVKEIDNLSTAFARNAGHALKKELDDVVAAANKNMIGPGGLSDSAIKQTLEALRDQAAEKALAREGAAIVTRDFGRLSDDFIELANKGYVDAAKGKQVNTSWLTGGLRLTRNPLRPGAVNVALPGTRGAGRKLTRAIFGTPVGSAAEHGAGFRLVKDAARGSGLRGVLDRKSGGRATRMWRDFMDRIGSENSLIRSIAEGKEGAIKLYDLQQSFNMMAHRIGTKAAAASLMPKSKALIEQMKAAGMKNEEADVFFRDLLDVIQGGAPLAQQQTHVGLAKAADEFVIAWQESFEKVHALAKDAGVQIGRQDAYIPLIKSKELVPLFEQMRAKGVVLRVADAASDEEARGMEALNSMYNAWLRRGQSDTYSLGANMHTQERALGITVDVLDMGPDMTIFQTIDGSKIQFIPHGEINSHVTAAAQAIAAEHGLTISKTFTALETNPFEIANKYLRAMEDTIMEATLVSEATRTGLIHDVTFKPNIGKMLANTQKKLAKISKKRLAKMEKGVTEVYDRADELATMKANGQTVPPLKKPKTVKRKVGDTTIDIDEAVADTPRVIRAIEQENRRYTALYGPQEALKASRDVKLKALVKRGVPKDVAEFVANSDSFESVARVMREVELALAEEAELLAAGGAEMAARTFASREGAMNESLAQLEAIEATARRQVVDAKKAAEGAYERAKAKAGIRPVRVAMFDRSKPEAQQALADQLSVTLTGRLEALADLADNMPNAERVAVGLRELNKLLEESGGKLTEESLSKVRQTLQTTRTMLEIMHGDTATMMTVPEWIANVPKLKNRMPVKQQEALIDEWDAMVDVRTPPKVELRTPVKRAKEIGKAKRAFTDSPLADAGGSGEIKSLFDPELTAQAEEAFEHLTDKQVVKLREEAYRLSQESLRHRGLPENVVVYRQISTREGAETVESFSLRNVSELYPNQNKYIVKREDILFDSNAFFPAGFVGEEEVLIPWGKVRPYQEADDAAATAAREAWFEGFRESYGVDLRSIPAAQRKKLKVLIAEMPEEPGAREVFEATKRKLLTVTHGQATDAPTKRSMQAMFVDAAAQAQKGGKRKAPAWAQFDVERARSLDPNTFFQEYGPILNEAARTDGTVARIWQTHQILYKAGMIGKSIDEELTGRLAADLEVLVMLQNNQNVWRDKRIRNNFERLFRESGMGSDSVLKGRRGGFAIESREQVQTLTAYDLRRQLKIHGFDGTIAEARQAVVDGTFDPKRLSPAAKNTLEQMPTADAQAIDDVVEAMERVRGMKIQYARGESPDALAKAVARAADAEGLLLRLARALGKRNSAGKMSHAGIREARAILDDPHNVRVMKEALGGETERLDHMRQMVESAEALQNADPIVRDVIESANKLREAEAFDPVKARETAQEMLDTIAQARTDEELADVQGIVDVFEMFNQKLVELYQHAPDMRGGGRLLATEAEDEMLVQISKDLEAYAKQLGWPDVGAALHDARTDRFVPTSEVADFVPSNAYGLTGAGVEGKMLQTDLARWMEHTMKVHRAMNTEDGIARFATGARQVLHWWKGMATVARPTFHARNFISATWANFSMDVRMNDYGFVKQHYPELRKLYQETGDWAAAARKMTDKKAQYYFENAALAGLFDSTFARSENVMSKAARATQYTKWQRANPLGTQGPLLHYGGVAMERIEGFHRLAAFVRHMDGGLTDPAQLNRAASYAMDVVNTVHFDYSNLTPLESWAKNFIPFFVWTRRNLPLQMRTAIERPALLARYGHMVHAGNDYFDADGEGGIRRYGGQFFIDTGIAMNADTPFWARFILDPDLPVKDLFELEKPLSPRSWFNLTTSLLGPQIQAPIKLMADDAYDVDAPVGWQAVTRMFKAATDENYTLQDRPQISNQMAALMQLAFPPASEYLTAFEQGQSRMQKQGIVDGDITSRIRAGALDLILPGLGLQTMTPHESYGVYTGSNMAAGDILRGLRKDGVIDAEMDEQIKQIIARSTGS